MEIEIEERIIFKPNDDISDLFSEYESSKTSYLWIKKANGQDVYKRIRSFRKDGLDVIISQVKRGIHEVTNGCGLALEYDEENATHAEELFLKYDDYCLLSSRQPLLSVYPRLYPTYRVCPFLKWLSEKATIDQVVLPNGRKIYIIEIEFSSIAQAQKGATELWNEMSRYGRLMKLRNFNKSRLVPKHPNHKSTLKSIERLYGW